MTLIANIQRVIAENALKFDALCLMQKITPRLVTFITMIVLSLKVHLCTVLDFVSNWVPFVRLMALFIAKFSLNENE